MLFAVVVVVERRHSPHRLRHTPVMMLLQLLGLVKGGSVAEWLACWAQAQ